MFDESDFISYFSDLEMFEQNARDLYEELSHQIKNKEVKELFLSLVKAEEHHKELVSDLRRMAIKKSISEVK